MKKAMFVSLVVLSLLVCVNAYGASLTYAPDRTSITVEPGLEMTVPLTVSIPGIARGTYYLWFIDSDLSANPPLSWVTASPATQFVSSYSPNAFTGLTVHVPEGTPPGVYTGTLLSKAMAAHEFANASTGMVLEVVVPARNSCSQSPEIVVSSFGPSYIWPPNHSMGKVTVSGNVILPEGCSLLKIGYAIDDEYGFYTSTGEFTVDADGYFTLQLPVMASRRGDDKDGRHYTISLFAENEAGMASVGDLNAIVPHDQRTK